jgi:3-oxoacyl-[acyl-carrier protein] reductase
LVWWPVATKINARILDPEIAEATARAVPMKRMGDTADMAGPCLFLSSRAASWITGVTIAVGGGIAFGTANM